ncbi:MAG: ABC transporter permease [Oligoflexales bacterium]
MLGYIVRRLLGMIPIILGVALLVFVLFTFVGEDPVRLALGNHATKESIAELRHQWGLDQPLPVQFLLFLKQIVTMDFGRSFNSGEQLSTMFARGALVSLALTVPAFIVSAIFSVCMGMLIAYYRGSKFDRWSAFWTIAGLSIPYLVYIIGGQYIFAYLLGWFPINGFEHGLAGIYYLLLPWLILFIVELGPEIRLYRTVFLDETKSDYVRTAFAKGASASDALFKHILKNAMIPIITNLVVTIPFLITGAFLMERFFGIPGVGDLILNAINTGDFPVLKGLTVLIAIGFAFFNLLSDILYAYVDPRVQLK